MKKSIRDIFFEETMTNLKDYFAIPSAGGMGEGPTFTVSNNKKQPSLNGRTFIVGFAPHRKDTGRQDGIGIVEVVGRDIVPQVVIHISPNIQDPTSLGIDRCGPETTFDVAESLEVTKLLNAFLASWKMDKAFSKTTVSSKAIN